MSAQPLRPLSPTSSSKLKLFQGSETHQWSLNAFWHARVTPTQNSLKQQQLTVVNVCNISKELNKIRQEPVHNQCNLLMLYLSDAHVATKKSQYHISGVNWYNQLYDSYNHAKADKKIKYILSSLFSKPTLLLNSILQRPMKSFCRVNVSIISLK